MSLKSTTPIVKESDKPKKKVDSNAKGRRGELAWIKKLWSWGFEGIRGGPKRDVICDALNEFHFEVKRSEEQNLYKALEQAFGACHNMRTPVVVHKRNRKPWIVVMYADDWLKERQKIEELRKAAQALLNKPV